jgi:hypothetical protein
VQSSKRVTSEPSSTAASFPRALDEEMAVSSIEVQPVHLLERGNARERLLTERRGPLEGMKDDPFEEIAERQTVRASERLQHEKDALLDADPRLDAIDRTAIVVGGRGGR